MVLGRLVILGDGSDKSTPIGRFNWMLVKRFRFWVPISCIFYLDEGSDVCTYFGHLYPMFVEVPPLRLMHIGKREVLALIDLMEDEWDTLMLLDLSAFGLEGGVDPSVDPQQQYGVKGVMPWMPAKKLQDERTLRSNHLGFQSQYELLATEAYLKANSAEPSQPLTIFEVRLKYLTFALKLDVCMEHLVGVYMVISLGAT